MTYAKLGSRTYVQNMGPLFSIFKGFLQFLRDVRDKPQQIGLHGLVIFSHLGPYPTTLCTLCQTSRNPIRPLTSAKCNIIRLLDSTYLLSVRTARWTCRPPSTQLDAPKRRRAEGREHEK